MSQVPTGYKRKPFPTLETGDKGIKTFVVDEFQRLENMLSNTNQNSRSTRSDLEDLTIVTTGISASLANAEAAIQNEQTVRASADSALASDITTITATVTQQGTDLTAAEAQIVAEQTARATADTAIASDVTTLTATVNQQGTDIAATQASVTSESAARANADSAIASDVTTLTATVNQQGTDIAATQASVTSESTARANADTAIASDVTTLTATVNQQGTDIAAAEADILSEQTARANADSAIASDLTTLTATVNQQGTDIAAAQSSITSEQTARASADSALATDITNLTATVNSGDATNAAAISAEQTARANAVSAVASDVTSLTASVASNAANTSTAISNAATAQAAADGKIDSFYQTSAPGTASEGDLWFDTNDGNKLYTRRSGAWVATQDSAIGTAIAAASTAQSTADGKVTSFYQTSAPTAEGVGDFWVDTNDKNKLYRWSGSAWVAVADVRITDNTAAINTESTARATADTALANDITTLTATVNSNNNTLSAAIANEQTARANADAANASDITTVSASVTAEAASRAAGDTAEANARAAAINTVTASIATEASVRAAADNTLLAKYGVTLNSNGYVTGFSQNNNGTSGTFKILADKFTIIDPAAAGSGLAGTQVFDITNGVVTMEAAFIKNLTTGNIVGDVNPTSAFSGSASKTFGPTTAGFVELMTVDCPASNPSKPHTPSINMVFDAAFATDTAYVKLEAAPVNGGSLGTYVHIQTLRHKTAAGGNSWTTIPVVGSLSNTTTQTTRFRVSIKMYSDTGTGSTNQSRSGTAHWSGTTTGIV